MNKQELFEKIFKEHLKVETFSKSIESLYSIRSKSKINYSPYYQRNYVWDDDKATYFIESILMGTEIPPLIFFNNNSEIEVIDGRQRFETILRFMNGDFSLTTKGLSVLNQLKGKDWDSIGINKEDIIESFIDTKLRIIEFRLVNHPPLDPTLQDQVKKEIFARYNSGITPLKKAEIDNAIYDDDTLSNYFKEKYNNNPNLAQLVYENFFKQPINEGIDLPIENILTFTRRALTLPLYPINYYVNGTGKTNTLAKLYQYYSDSNIDNEKTVFENFIKKVTFLDEVRQYSEQHNLKNNRLALECFLWGLGVLEIEEVLFDKKDLLIEKISQFIDTNIAYFTLVDYNFSAETITRYLSTAEFFTKEFSISYDIYMTATDKRKSELKKISKTEENSKRLSDLNSLRLSKPEPTNNSIDDIIRIMNKRRYLIRPSYQRKEVIDINKASSIIESILLGIKLPPIFVFKRDNGTNEVIDGQQRLLTLLGFIGENFLNEKGKSVKSKNHKFSLRKLRILKELNSKKFQDLSEGDQNKILDFQIYVVEIDAIQNPNFDPVDLFIRLNNKPYPIRENSFEMWNSWANVDVIEELKKLKTDIDGWFYIKQLKRTTDRDRMQNEELITSLCYIDYYKDSDYIPKTIDVYQKSTRITSRISTKAKISGMMLKITEDEDERKNFLCSIKNVKNNIKKIKYVLIDKDVKKDKLLEFLKKELDFVFNGGKKEKGFRRRIQDFYFLWILIEKLNFEMVKFHRINMKKEIFEIFQFIKTIPQELENNNLGFIEYERRVKMFHDKYKQDSRKTILSEEKKLELIKQQGGTSSLSSAPIFLGDDIEVDHIKPLAIGGKDETQNLGIAHKTENRKKGVKN